MTLDLEGRVVAHSDTRLLGSYLQDLPATDPKADESRVFILSHTAQLVDVVTPVILANRQVGWVRVGLGQQTISRRLAVITRDGILYAIAAILIGSVLAGIMGLRLTRRLYAIQQVTDAVQAGDAQRRAQVRGSDEAAGLAEAFNGMLDTLGRQRQALIDSREALAESRERFDLAMRGANDGLWDWNLETNEVYYSQRWKAMLGYRDEELENIFSTWEMLVEPVGHESTLQVIEDYVESRRQDFEVEFRMRHKQGHWVDILSRAHLVRGESGKPLRLVGTHVDISERKRLEASLRQRETHLHTLLQTLPDLIWLKDPDGVYLACNARFERFFGVPEADIVGKTDYNFVDKELADFFREHDRKAVAAGRPSVNEEWIAYADGGHRLPVEPVQKSTVVVEKRRGRVLGLAPGQPNFRILVAEDNPDNQRLIEALLKRAGFEVSIVANGQLAIQQVQSWHPHFIWMDMRMPVMDGYEATRRIKAMPEGAKIHIAALTASAFDEEREAVLESGCAGFVRKPIDAEELFAVMHDLLGVSYRYEKQSGPGMVASGELDPQAIAELPKELRESLREAAEQLDVEALNRMAERIAEHSNSLAEALTALAAEFRFDVIIQAVQNA